MSAVTKAMLFDCACKIHAIVHINNITCLLMLLRSLPLKRSCCQCVFKLPQECHTLLAKNLYTETLQQEIACMCVCSHSMSKSLISILILRIDSNFVIKVSDFGLTEDVYAKNYFRQGMLGEGDQVKLPVRWMALESLNNGVFTEKTDVVSGHRLINHSPVLSMLPAILVVIWCDMLGGVLTGENSLPWSGPLYSHQVPGERREAGKTRQCSLL